MDRIGAASVSSSWDNLYFVVIPVPVDTAAAAAAADDDDDVIAKIYIYIL